jgi:hypothetical protein
MSINPFGLSLSKAVPSLKAGEKQLEGFDRLSPNGFGTRT